VTQPLAQPALQQLLDLAEHTRPDLDRETLQGVLVGHRDAGVKWPWLMLHTVRMLAQGGDLRDLRHALEDHTKTRSSR
jgi:hypothetical protein